MNKLLTLFLFALLTLFVLPSAVSADYGCEPSVYGSECQTANLSIEKFVKNPSTGEMVANLEASQPHFLADQKVTFKLKISNNSNKQLKNIEIKDRLPEYTEFVSGPGKFDSSSKTLSFSIDKLNGGEFREYEIVGKIKPKSELSNNPLSCVTNYAETRADGMFSSDTSVYCIENQILAPVQELPKTGPVSTGLLVAGSIGFLTMSLLFFKKARVI